MFPAATCHAGVTYEQGRAAASSGSAAMDIMQRYQYSPVDIEGGDQYGARRYTFFRPATLLRYTLLVFALVGMLLCFSGAPLSYAVKHLDMHAEFERSALRETEELVWSGNDVPFPNEWTCPQDGRVCICAHGFAADGLKKHGEIKFVEREGYSACQPWLFKVGDVLAFERPTGGVQEQLFTAAKFVSTVTHSPIVHTAIVTQVPPLGVNQTATNVIVTEAVKGMWKMVVQNPLRYVIERWPFGGFWIRRIDPQRFPSFANRSEEINTWASARVHEPFDADMLVPFKRRFTTGRRYVTPNPDCEERKRALKMYEDGGPGKWICSEFVSWVLAFAGGLNLDYHSNENDNHDKCELPRWTIKNIQQNPGELMRDNIFDPDITWKIPCGVLGCYMGVPYTPDWAGGTTAAPTTAAPANSTNETGTNTTSVEEDA